MENNINIPFPNFSFSEHIQRKANRFAKARFPQPSMHSHDDMNTLENEIETLYSDGDKIQFIGHIISVLTDSLYQHELTCDKGERCGMTINTHDVLYYLYGELGQLGININPEQFTKEETSQNNDTINKIIRQLDEIKAGQEIIFNEVDQRLIGEFQNELTEAKDLQVLGKKKWFRYVSGIVGEYATNKVIDAIFKGTLLPYLKQFALGKFLE